MQVAARYPRVAETAAQADESKTGGPSQETGGFDMGLAVVVEQGLERKRFLVNGC